MRSCETSNGSRFASQRETSRGIWASAGGVNLSGAIDPIFGGFIATQSYLLLFIADAVSSLITGIIVFLVIPETKPEKKEGETEETVVKTVIGYKEVLKD